MEQDLRKREDEIMQKLTDMWNKDKDHNDEWQRNLEEIRRLKNRIKDQELSEDLWNNYAYLIMFNNWKKKKEGMGDMPSEYWGKPQMGHDPHWTPRNPWTEAEHNGMQFPTVEEIDKMNLNIDLFDVEWFNSL